MLTRNQPDNKGACDLWISTLQNAKHRLPPKGSIAIYSVQEPRESGNLLNLQKWLCSKSQESLDQVKWITMVRKKKTNQNHKPHRNLSLGDYSPLKVTRGVQSPPVTRWTELPAMLPLNLWHWLLRRHSRPDKGFEGCFLQGFEVSLKSSSQHHACVRYTATRPSPYRACWSYVKSTRTRTLIGTLHRSCLLVQHLCILLDMLNLNTGQGPLCYASLQRTAPLNREERFELVRIWF